MPQRKQLTWTQLRVGVLIISGLVVLAVGIFFISGEVGGFLTHHYTLKAYFPDAESLREGAQVKLAGIVVGNVEEIRLSSFSKPSKAVQVNMKVTQKYQDQIRTNSVATIETAGLLGEAYINITRGGPQSKPIPNGGTVKSQEEANIKQVVKNTNDVLSNLSNITQELSGITRQIQKGQGSIGKLIYSDAFAVNLNKTVNEAQKMMAQIQEGHGTLGKLMTDDTLYNHTVTAVNNVNKILGKVESGNGTAAKLINDPSVYNNLNHAAKTANTLMANINESKGTLGKLIKDPSLYNHLDATAKNVDVITGRIDRGEGTLGRLSTDPAMYNNLLSASQSLRLFLREFRTNPRRYLTLRLHIF